MKKEVLLSQSLVFILCIGLLTSGSVFLSSCHSEVANSAETDEKSVEFMDDVKSNALKPHIVFKNLEHDFGTIVSGKEASTEYEFKNDGNAELIIEKVKASCGCTAALASSERVLPGETGKIAVTFKTKGRSGKQRKSITVTTNDPDNRTVHLKFSADVSVIFGFEPQRLYFGRNKSSQGIKKTITAIGEKLGKAQILSSSIVDASHEDYYEIDIIDNNNETNREIQLSVSLTNKVPVGRFKDILQIQTDLVETPTVDIIIYGQITGPIEVLPQSILLKKTDNEKVFAGSVTLKSGLDTPFEVKEVTCDDDRVKVDIGSSADKHSTTIALSLDSESPVEKQFKAILTISTDLKEQAEITVPVRISMTSREKVLKIPGKSHIKG